MTSYDLFCILAYKKEGKMKSNKKIIDANGNKITIVTKRRTSMGNPVGYSAKVNDNQGNELIIHSLFVAHESDAQEIAYERFIKKFEIILDKL